MSFYHEKFKYRKTNFVENIVGSLSLLRIRYHRKFRDLQVVNPFFMFKFDDLRLRHTRFRNLGIHWLKLLIFPVCLWFAYTKCKQNCKHERKIKDEHGEKVVQQLSNKLRCKIRAYAGQVSQKGKKTDIMKDENIPWGEKVFYYDPSGKTFYPK